MFRFEKRNRIWLVALSVLMLLVVISPNIAAPVQAGLLGIFFLALVATTLSADAGRNLMKSLGDRVTAPVRSSRMSSQAREAAERAHARGEHRSTGLDMVDVGIIASQSGSEGMVMRRTRSVSKDDDGVRPFITLHVPPGQADRNATVRFEFIDQNGHERYLHSMKVYLRDGEFNVLADHHLPMMGNDQIAGMGEWDLRVYIDEVLVGVHGFQLVPSVDERRQRVGGGGQHFVTEDEDARRDRLSDEPPRRASSSEPIPMSLEELLRSQGNEER